MSLRSILSGAIVAVMSMVASAQYTAHFTSPADNSYVRLFSTIKFQVGGPLPFQVTLTDDLGHVLYTQFFIGQPPIEISVGFDPIALGIADGWHKLTLTVSGNLGTTTAELNLGVDNTAPFAQITNPQNGGCVSGSVSVTGLITDNFSGPGNWDLYIDNVKKSSGSGSPTLYTWDTTGLADLSTHTLQLKVKDVAGNSFNSAVTTVTVNNTAPSLINIVPPGGSVVGGVVTIGANTSNNQTVDWTVAVDGQAAGIVPTTGSGTTVSASWDTRVYSNGSHLLQITIADNCGGHNTYSLSLTVSNSQGGGGGGGCVELKNLIVGDPVNDPFTSTPVTSFRPQEICLDDITVRDVLEGNQIQIDSDLIVQRVRFEKHTPYYKCLAFVFGPGSGNNTNFTSGWQYATNADLDKSVCNVAFKLPSDEECLGCRCLLFSPPGTRYSIQVTYVTRLPNGRISQPYTVELCWTVVIEDRDDIRANIEYFSTVAAGATQKCKIDKSVVDALNEALDNPFNLDALFQFETVIALAAIDFSPLRDRKPNALLFHNYLLDSDEEPIGCLLIEQANALLWHP